MAMGKKTDMPSRCHGIDTSVTVATDVQGDSHRVTRTAFLTSEAGRRRAATIAAAELWMRLGELAS